MKIINPLDELFNFDEGIEETFNHDVVNSEECSVPPVTASAQSAPQSTAGELIEKDQEDIEIDQKIDEVYDAAMQSFKSQTEYMDIIEPRYAARNAEVAANYLNIALQAANSRAKVKGDRKRNSTFIPYQNGKVTNNTIVASREDILRMLSVDAETKEF